MRDLLDELPVYGPALTAVSPLLPYTDASGPLPVIQNAAGERVVAIVFAIDGALESLGGGTASPSGPGVWIPDGLATELRLEPGDRVDVALVRPNADEATAIPPVPVTVAGVYPTSDGLPVSTGFDWSAVPGGVPDDPIANEGPARLLLTDEATALSLIASMGDVSLVTWDAAVAGTGRPRTRTRCR